MALIDWQKIEEDGGHFWRYRGGLGEVRHSEGLTRAKITVVGFWGNDPIVHCLDHGDPELAEQFCMGSIERYARKLESERELAGL